jgi:hypothetical protein
MDLFDKTQFTDLKKMISPEWRVKFAKNRVFLATLTKKFRDANVSTFYFFSKYGSFLTVSNLPI